MLQTAEQEKQKKYLEAVQTRVLCHEENVLIKCLAEKIAYKWVKSLSEVTGWVWARMAFAILRATSLCLQEKNGDMGLVWMMVQVYPLVKNKICDICVL